MINVDHHNVSDFGKFGEKHGFDADNVGLPSLRMAETFENKKGRGVKNNQVVESNTWMFQHFS